MTPNPDRPDRSVTGPMETFLSSAGGQRWADVERRPVLRAELEGVHDDLIEQDADFPPDDAYGVDGDVGALLREFDRQLRHRDA